MLCCVAGYYILTVVKLANSILANLCYLFNIQIAWQIITHYGLIHGLISIIFKTQIIIGVTLALLNVSPKTLLLQAYLSMLNVSVHVHEVKQCIHFGLILS